MSKFTRMFRLLAILIALNFSSRADGAPHITLMEGEKNAATSDIIDREDLVLNARNADTKDAPALEGETKSFPRTEKDEGVAGPEPGLKPRGLCGSKDAGSESDKPTGSRRKNRKGKSGQSKSAKRTRGRENGTSSSSGSSGSSGSPGISRNSGGMGSIKRGETGSQEESSGATVELHSVTKPMETGSGPSSPPEVVTQSMFDNLFATRSSKSDAEIVVNLARNAIKEPGADPYTDEDLAQQIDVAIDKYNRAHDRPKFHPKEKDDRQRMKEKLDKLHEIGAEIDGSNQDLKNLLAQLEAVQLREKN